MKTRLLAIACLLLPLSVHAETVYVREVGTADMRAGPLATDPVVKEVTSGISLTVIERRAETVHVRDADGVEGWIRAVRLTEAKPSALLLLAAETKLKQAQKELASAGERIQSLEAELKKSQPAPGQPAEPAPEPDATPPVGKRPVFSFDPLWMLISFAMLIGGFAAGVLWLREQTRRKLGGMHIRVS